MRITEEEGALDEGYEPQHRHAALADEGTAQGLSQACKQPLQLREQRFPKDHPLLDRSTLP